MSNFYTLLTRVGAALHANAQVNQTTVPWTHMRLGDGNGAPVTPTENQTSLVHQVHTLQITDIAVHPDNPNWVIAEAVVPSDVGGWTVRETAIYGGADGNTCIAVGNYPETYKPVLAEGAGREMVMRMVVEISSVATVKLQIDPAVAIASRAWVESLVATPAKAGLVKLANEQEHLDGEIANKSATPAGVAKMLAPIQDQLKKVGIAGMHINLRASATGTNAFVPITAGELNVGNASGEVLRLRSVDVTINTAELGTNGLDTGVLAANTWYSVWVVSDGVNVRGLASLSATEPTMPAGYTYKARVGWIRTDGTANKYPLPFLQNGNRVEWIPTADSNLIAKRLVASGVQGNISTPAPIDVALSAFIPETATAVTVMVRVSGSSPNTVYVDGVRGFGVMTSANPPRIALSGLTYNVFLSATSSIPVNDGKIFYVADSPVAALFCLGWEDSL